MVTWLMVMAVGAFLGMFEVEKDGVRVRAHIRSSKYYWEVTNIDAEPITRFEISQHNCYDYQVPDGWESEAAANVFRAWATDPGRAIRRGATERFSLRVSSTGAVLGLVAMRVGPDAGEGIIIPEVWGPVPEPPSTVFLVAIVLVAIVLVHAWLLGRRERDRPLPNPNDV